MFSPTWFDLQLWCLFFLHINRGKPGMTPCLTLQKTFRQTRIQRLPCCLKSGGVNLFEPGSFAFQHGQLFVLALPGWRYPRLVVLPNALV